MSEYGYSLKRAMWKTSLKTAVALQTCHAVRNGGYEGCSPLDKVATAARKAKRKELQTHCIVQPRPNK